MFRTLLIAGLALVGTSAAQAQTASKTFEFVALGDMPYKLPDDYEKFDRLIALINQTKPSFSVHVGDIKSGSTPCTDENFRKVFDQFATFEQPLVYTIGDNEWTDCHREKAGKFQPLERLAKVRQMFFAAPGQSLGKNPMPVESEGLVMADTFGTYIENARWEKNGVVFATVHVPGSNNNFEPGDPRTAMEYFDRDPANVAWIDSTFKKATEGGARAVVLAWQADVQDIKQNEPEVPRASAFVNTIKAVERGAKAFGKPVLVIHGDNHRFEVTSFLDTSRKPIPNVLRLQVMGETLIHAVKVTVDPDSPGVFGFTPLIVPGNALN